MSGRPGGEGQFVTFRCYRIPMMNSFVAQNPCETFVSGLMGHRLCSCVCLLVAEDASFARLIGQFLMELIE